jgi:hypothetical protein
MPPQSARRNDPKGEKTVTSFKLKSDVTFTPDQDRYVVFDGASHSTYRVGESEYRILKHFKQATNLEEVSYRLRAEMGVGVPFDKLNRFLRKAIDLNLIEVVDDSLWSRVKASGPFAFRVRFFDPTTMLERLIRLSRRSGHLYLILAGVLFLAALAVNVAYFRELWSVRSLHMPPYGPMVLLLIYMSSIGHEMSHGLAAKWYGFEVPEVGFHMHYYMPSFYCKILRGKSAGRKSIGVVLLAGSLFDFAILTALVLIWFLSPVSEGVKEVIAFAVSLIWLKILLIQLNPLLPLSDGYRIVGLFFSRWREKRWQVKN